jgi:hypothetical protein
MLQITYNKFGLIFCLAKVHRLLMLLPLLNIISMQFLFRSDILILLHSFGTHVKYFKTLYMGYRLAELI